MIKVRRPFVMLIIAVAAIPAGSVLISTLSKQPMQSSIEWDLEQGHTVDRLDWPGEMMDEDGLAELPPGRRHVTIRLPGDKTFRATVEHVIVDKVGNKIFCIWLRFPKANLKQSVAKGKELLLEFGYDDSGLQSWYERQSKLSYIGSSFEHYYRGGTYPISISVKDAWNSSNPWRVSFKLYFETTESLK